VLALMTWIVPGAASAHKGSPNYRSTVRAIRPSVAGLKVQVLNYDDRLQLQNKTGRDIEIRGYSGEPYARVLADGTVEVNKNSPSYYLNEDRFGNTTVPPTATNKATPQWNVIDKTGRFEWHDHRMHWMSQQPPSQVQGVTKKTKIFDWTVPLKIGASAGAIKGTLFWTPQVQSGPPAMAINLLVGLVILVCIGIAVVRRRRTPSAPASASAPAKEAW
jgi:hypothetical protein